MTEMNDLIDQPTPVVVVLMAAMGHDQKEGLLIVQRNSGDWDLPCTRIVGGEDWKIAASRALKEETGLDFSPDTWAIWDVKSDLGRGELLVYVTADHECLGDEMNVYVADADVQRHYRSDRVAGVDVMYDDAWKMTTPLARCVALEYLLLEPNPV